MIRKQIYLEEAIIEQLKEIAEKEIYLNQS